MLCGGFLHKPLKGDRKDRFAGIFMGEIQVSYSQAYSAFWHCSEHPRHPHGLANVCDTRLPGHLHPSGVAAIGHTSGSLVPDVTSGILNTWGLNFCLAILDS